MYPGSGSIVLLNASFEPLATNLTLQRAARLLAKGKAVVHEGEEGRFLKHWPWPKVLLLVKYVKIGYSKLRGPAPYSKKNVLKRDGYRCGYCGKHADTIDHVRPRSQGGKTEWRNAVAACGLCNGRKANRTPAEAGMKLRITPYPPSRFQLAAL